MSVAEQKKYYFYKNPTYNGWEISYTTVFSDLGLVYFISVEVAARAIDEIVIFSAILRFV